MTWFNLMKFDNIASLIRKQEAIIGALERRLENNNVDDQHAKAVIIGAAEDVLFYLKRQERAVTRRNEDTYMGEKGDR